MLPASAVVIFSHLFLAMTSRHPVGAAYGRFELWSSHDGIPLTAPPQASLPFYTCYRRLTTSTSVLMQNRNPGNP